MRPSSFIFFAGAVLLTSSLIPTPSTAHNNGVALTPPMGWSTWNLFYCNYNENDIKQIADAMVATGMLAAGYQYLNIDDCWMGERNATTGDMTWDTNKFPNGLPALIDYVHSKGLSFGLYSSSGPLTCQNFTGSWLHEAQDAALFASWGIDFFKLDCCWQDNIVDRERAYNAMSDGLLATGRPIVFSCDTDELLTKDGNKEFPYIWGPSRCNMARIWWDINDHWPTTLQIVDRASNLAPFTQPGYFNDYDILTVGLGGQSINQYQAQFSLWSLFASPLIAGHDIRNMSSDIANILLNKEVIAVNQDPLALGGTLLNKSIDGMVEVWGRPLYYPSDPHLPFTISGPPPSKYIPHTKHAVVLFNRGNIATMMTLLFEDLYGNALCCPAPDQIWIANVRDIWAGQELGLFTETYSTIVPPQSVVMLTVTKTN